LRARRPGELGFALAALAFSLWVLWQAWRISGFSSWSSPGAAPMLGAFILVVSAAVFVVRTARMPAAAGDIREILPRAVIAFTALIAAYMLALERLGFLLSSFLFLVGAMWVLGNRRVLFPVCVALVSLAAIYLVFQTAFSVVLPEGWLERTLLR
jgi:putative tricarboxylic transport membrane protein